MPVGIPRESEALASGRSLFAPGLNPQPSPIDFGIGSLAASAMPPVTMPVADLTPSMPDTPVDWPVSEAPHVESPLFEPLPSEALSPEPLTMDWAATPADMATAPETTFWEVEPPSEVTAETRSWAAEPAPMGENSFVPSESSTLDSGSVPPELPPGGVSQSDAEALWYEMAPSEPPSPSEPVQEPERAFDMSPMHGSEVVLPDSIQPIDFGTPMLSEPVPDLPALETLPDLAIDWSMEVESSSDGGWSPSSEPSGLDSVARDPFDSLEPGVSPVAGVSDGSWILDDSPAVDAGFLPGLAESPLAWEAPNSADIALDSGNACSSGWDAVTADSSTLDAMVPHVDDGALWANLERSDDLAGRQVPIEPQATGQFLDDVGAQLYPQDPLGLPMAHMMAGEQAFSDAAAYLMPETLDAPLEWMEEDTTTVQVPEGDGGLTGPAVVLDGPVELGPSFQVAPGDGLNDFSSLAPDPAPAVQFSPPPAEAKADSSIMPEFSAPLPDEGLAAWPDPDFDPQAVWFPEPAGTEMDALADQADSFVLDGSVSADGSMQADVSAPDYLADQDFYAASFSFGAHGEIVPDLGDETAYGAEESPAFSGEETLLDEGMSPPSEWPLDDRLSLPPLPVESGRSVGLPPVILPGTGFSEEVAPEESLWDAFPEPEAADVTLPAAVASGGAGSAVEMDWDALEILAVCQLNAMSRLLLVKNQAIYALMGQSGPEEEPVVSVLKTFDENPIAYQNTFTAVEEGHVSQAQGMYVVQLGTWHGIISTFQQSMTLHTELG